MDKVLGLDLGTTTLGIAMIDSLGFIFGVENYRFPVGYYKLAKERVKYHLEREKINLVVLGYPLNMNGEEGDRTKSVERFKSELEIENPNVKFILVDERLSTVEAHERLINQGYSLKKRKEIIDMVSAEIILENYLARLKEGKI